MKQLIEPKCRSSAPCVGMFAHKIHKKKTTNQKKN